MKAFILAAGEGTRLRPITNRVPKCLVPIRGVPMLAIWLQICRENGIDDILINLHNHAEMVRSFLDEQNVDMNIRVVQETSLLGSAGTLRANRDWVCGDKYFWIFYADVLNRADLQCMARLHEKRWPAATLGVYEVPDPTRCGIVCARADGIIDYFVEKPKSPPGNLAFSGLMIGTPAMLDVIPATIPADLGFDVLPKLVGRMLAFPIHDYLIDIGTMTNYRLAQANWPGIRCAEDG